MDDYDRLLISERAQRFVDGERTAGERIAARLYREGCRRLTKMEIDVLTLMADEQDRSAAEVGDALGIGYGAAGWTLCGLENAGVMVRTQDEPGDLRWRSVPA